MQTHNTDLSAVTTHGKADSRLTDGNLTMRILIDPLYIYMVLCYHSGYTVSVKNGKKETGGNPVRVRRRKCVCSLSKANRIALKVIGREPRRRENAKT
jgi:hypothetical protein